MSLLERLLSENQPSRPGSAQRPQEEQVKRLKDAVKDELKDQLREVSIFSSDIARVREEWRPKVREAIQRLAPRTLPESVLLSVLDEVIWEIFGVGRLQPLVDDPTVTDILVVAGRHVYVVRAGRTGKERVGLELSPDETLRIIQRIAFDPAVNRRIDESMPMLNARLPDGSRVHAVIPPISPDGPALSIRKFPERVPSVDDLIRWGSITEKAARFLKACVLARCNILVSGPTGSGKTTLLNVLSEAIPDDERIVTIEDALELQVWKKKPHVVRLEARPPGAEGKGEVTIAQLVKETLRMMPDRIIVGEVRREEAAEMLNAMSTGHDGSMSTMHANSPRDAVERLIYMASFAGVDIPYLAWHRIIAGALHLIVHQTRLEDGSRRVTHVTEVAGVGEDGRVVLRDVFRFRVEGQGPDGRVLGRLVPTGTVPDFKERFRLHRVEYDWSELERGGEP